VRLAIVQAPPEAARRGGRIGRSPSRALRAEDYGEAAVDRVSSAMAGLCGAARAAAFLKPAFFQSERLAAVSSKRP